MSKSTPKDHRETPTYWFAILEIARERSDQATADEANRQLHRLGVHVCYDPREHKEAAR